MSRFSNISFRPVASKAISMTGGLNEAVNNLELKSGELLECKNYTELDGVYSGYRLVDGYERFDGSALASDTAIDIYQDTGINTNTVLLIESTKVGETPVDLSYYNQTVTKGFNVLQDPTTKAFGNFSYRADNSALSSEGLLVDYTSDLSTDEDFTIDIITMISDYSDEDVLLGTDVLIIELYSGILRLKVEDSINGYIVVPLTITTLSSWMKLRITFNKASETFKVFEDGILKLSYTMPNSLVNASSYYVINQNTTGSVWIDSIRITKKILNTQDYAPIDLPFSHGDYYQINYDDTAREVARAAIDEVTGDVAEDVVGIHSHKGDKYAIRNDGTVDKLYRAAGGWAQVTGTVLTQTEKPYKFVSSRFNLFDANEENFFFVNGVDAPHYSNGATATVIDDRVFIPPINLATFENRLFLAYPNGNVLISAVGDPTDFTSAEELLMGSEIVDIKNGPGNTLVFFLERGIKLVKGVDDGLGGISFQTSEYSNSSNCIANTARRSLSDIYFITTSGLTSFAATDAFGDFEEGILSKKVQNTLIAKLDLITDTAMKKKENQYRVFFSDNTAIYFTFKDKKVKGATIVEFDTPVLTTTRDNNDIIWFGSGDFIYKMDSGTSFDGGDIVATFTTSYHSYGYPRHWKRFRSLLFEITAEALTEVVVQPHYNYNKGDFPDPVDETRLFYGTGGIWGVSTWGSFVWGSGATVDNPTFYTNGRGINMGIQFSYTGKYIASHTIHNLITDYTVNKRRE